MTWPDSPLDVRTQVMGSSGWQTVTTRRSTEIAVQRPRSGEQATFAPAVTAVELPSNNGEWLPGGSNAPSWWGLGVPLRISVPGDGTYLRLEDFTSWAQAPDSVPLHITGDTDIRLDCKPTDYRFAALCSKSDPSGTHAWLLDRLSDGTLQFFWWDSGANLKSVQSTLPVPLGRIAIRVTLSVATGTVTFYTAPNISGTWTQLGTAASGTGGAATSVNAATAPVRVGDQAVSSTGAYFGFQLRNGIGGTVAASPDFTAQAAGTTSFTDAQGNVWALNGTAELSDRDYRYHGQVTEIDPQWADASGRVASVTAQAGGILERLVSAEQPAWSAMRRYVQSLAGDLKPVACWPMEDGSGATQFAEISSSDPAANPIAVTAGTPGSDSVSFVCTAPLAVLGNIPAEVGVTVPDFTPGTTTVIRMLANVTEADATTGGQLLSIAMDDNATLLVTRVNAAGNIRLALSGGIDTGFVTFGSSVIGRPLMYSWELTLSGGAVQVRFLTWDISGGNVIGPSAVGYSGTLKIPRVKIGGPLINATCGFLKVQRAFTDVAAETAALNAYRGELAANRVSRLLGWAGIPCRIIGYPDASEAMSGEPPATLSDLLQQVEDADGGVVFEPRQAAAVGYRTRASMTGQAAAVSASYAAGHVGGTGTQLTPKLNNSTTVNDVTAVQKGIVGGGGIVTGSSARAVLDDGSRMSVSPPEQGGSGRWDKSYDTWVHDDSQLAAVANRRLARGTVAGTRWPVIPFALANPQLASLRGALRRLDIGGRVTVADMPAGLHDLDQLAWGMTEVLGSKGGKGWDVSVNMVPALPWAGSGIVGAYLNQVNFEQADWNGVAGLWGTWTGKAATGGVTRYYAGTNYAYTTDLQEMVAAGTRIAVSFSPGYNPVSSADRDSITGLLATLKTAGADVLATIWHEPSQNGLTAGQFTAACQYYAPAMRAYYPFWICLNGDAALESNGYYPGSDITDGCAVDEYYFNGLDFTRNNGVVEVSAMADHHRKPFAVWEFGAAPGPNFFQGDNHSFAATIGNWTGLANISSFFHSTVVNPFGNGNTGALAFNPAAAGDMAVQSAQAANFATQMQACAPGDEITVGDWFQAAATSRTCKVGAAFYTAAGAAVSTLYSADASATTTDPVGGWSSAMGKVTAPATAAFYTAACKVQAAAVGETHRIGMAYAANSTQTGTTQANVTAFYEWIQSTMLARIQSGLRNGDVILFNGGMPGSGNAVAIQHAADYRIGLWLAMKAALDGAV